MRITLRALLALPALFMIMTGCSQQEAEVPVAEEAAPPATEGPSAEAIMAEALSAAPASMADSVTVADWAGNVYREGTSAYTCLPTPPNMTPGTSPMCMDGPWMAWAQAWGSKSELSIDSLGISYMLAGDGGASNIDPYAAGPAEDNDWLVEGPHLMVITPDATLLDALPTDYNSGGPYVMWKDSPYAHIMVPVELADAHTTAGGTVEEALSAATTKMAARAKVMDWEGNVLQEGDGAHICLPTPPIFADGFAPMCMDDQWMAWAHAWGNQEAVTTEGIGFSYMLAGDAGGSNTDPYGREPTDDNEWVVSGPHMMIIVPDSADLAGLSTDSQNGGPYVMWRDTPYAHVMIPIGD